MKLGWLSICLFSYTLSTSVGAWQVYMHEDEEGSGKPRIAVENKQELAEVDVYLVWLDLDARDPQTTFFSWRMDDWDWQAGLLPISDHAIDVPKLPELDIGPLPRKCPGEHRCFLALVATSPGADPLLNEKWQASSLLPLSVTAGQERLPGQQFFLPPNSEAERVYAVDMAESATAEGEAPASPTVNKDNEGEASGVETEKPDIFRLIDRELLYVNAQAKRFQIIDLKDPKQPQLVNWASLKGVPLELYVVGAYYVLLQTDYQPGVGTYLTVFEKTGTGQLTMTQELTLSGRFIESRRQDDRIYVVIEEFTTVDANTTDCVDCVIGQPALQVHAFQIDGAGQLTATDRLDLGGYSPIIAIFPNYLVVANHDPEQWITTQITLFDLATVPGKLSALPTLEVPGQVPSEFHLNVQNQQFRVVYGPENREKGSTLAVYDLLSPKLSLLGQVSNIAPGETLYATRFHESRAFVVTFEQKDPLWVIELADPTAPKIIGELHVPGWSEKLFFHENQLLAIGIDDQPLPSEQDQWVSRVSLSLFDVSDPTNPSLLSKLTPLAGKSNYSYSMALYDEQALLLDWEENLTAFPMEAWQETGNYHLQIVSLTPKHLIDLGLLQSPVSLERSFILEENVLGALGNEALLTIEWGTDQPKILGQLELAVNLGWLAEKDGNLWAAAWGGQGGFNRLHRYQPTDVETPQQKWQLPKGYEGLRLDGNLAFFYNSYSPLTVQILETDTGTLYEAQALEPENSYPSYSYPEPAYEDTESVVSDDMEVTPDGMVEATEVSEDKSGIREEAIEEELAERFTAPIWYERSQPLVHKGLFYLGEQRLLEGVAVPYLELSQSSSEWKLRSWALQGMVLQEQTVRSIPGRPLAINTEGQLITQESTDSGFIRLNLLALEAENARLINSQPLDCRNHSQLMWVGDGLYIDCEIEEQQYWIQPILYEEEVVETSTDKAESENSVSEEVKEETLAITRLLKLNGQLAKVGEWEFSGNKRLQIAASDKVLLANDYWYYGPFRTKPAVGKAAPVVANSQLSAQSTGSRMSAKMSIMPPYYGESGCDVYQLQPQNEPKLLKHLEECPYYETNSVLGEDQIWSVEGFAGIQFVKY